MHTPETLTQRLQTEEDIDAAVEVYKTAQDAVKSYEAVKEAARAFVSAHLAQSGRLKGKTTAGSFGITRPTPTFRVNEDKWRAACAQDSRLAAVQKQFNAAQRALDQAQRNFLEEVTPEPVVYIR